jgi:hypothetical protein
VVVLPALVPHHRYLRDSQYLRNVILQFLEKEEMRVSHGLASKVVWKLAMAVHA